MVKFEWKGATETESGRAIYEIGTATYELWLPNFAKAFQLNQVLTDVYRQGRQQGHTEMVRATSAVMREVAMKG